MQKRSIKPIVLQDGGSHIRPHNRTFARYPFLRF